MVRITSSSSYARNDSRGDALYRYYIFYILTYHYKGCYTCVGYDVGSSTLLPVMLMYKYGILATLVLYLGNNLVSILDRSSNAYVRVCISIHHVCCIV